MGKILCVFNRSVVSDSLPPHELQPARLLFPCGFFRQEYWSRLPCPPPEALPYPGIEPRSPRLWADSLLSESSGKPKNTGVGSLSLLQGILPTQESNQGLPHCRWIHQLSYQGSPIYHYQCFIFYTVNLSHALKKSSTLKKVTKGKANFF